MLKIFRFAPAAANLRLFRGLFILPGDQREFAAGFSARSLLFSDLLRSPIFMLPGAPYQWCMLRLRVQIPGFTGMVALPR